MPVEFILLCKMRACSLGAQWPPGVMEKRLRLFWNRMKLMLIAEGSANKIKGSVRWGMVNGVRMFDLNDSLLFNRERMRSCLSRCECFNIDTFCII